MIHLMKTLFKTIAAAVLALSAAACTTDPPGWKLVWTEDFNGPSIDTTVWTRVEKGLSDWDDMMSPRADLAYIENGELVLKGQVADSTQGDTTPFVTAGIHSRKKKSFSMARFDVRAKFNSANGFWPAIWLMPDAPLPEPEYAEIDIMEHTNFDHFAYQTVHSRYTLNGGEEPPHSGKGAIDREGWNIYTAEVYRDSVCFYTNGVKSLTYPRIEGAAHQFYWADCPFYMILSNQLGGVWVGKVDAPQQLPSQLRIDWIKVYAPKKTRPAKK